MPDAAIAPAPALTRGVTVVLAVGAGVCVANIYYNQPMLGVMARAMPGGGIGLVPMATQLGYALGLLLLVPLGDRIVRRRVILVQMAAMSGAMALAALAPGAGWLVAACVAVGVASSAAQQIIPLAADLAEPWRRGAAVGLVMSGLLCGILLGRTLAGAVSAWFGWRAMFGLGAAMSVAMTVVFYLTLPATAPSTDVGYARLLGSLGTLVRRHPALLRASLVQGCLFGAFSVFWTVLALRLAAAPLHLGSEVAGLFGLVGLAGIGAAPVAGWIADRRGPQMVVGLGAACVVVAWVVFGAFTGLAGLVAGVVMLDLGIQAALISNQAFVYGLQPDARGRINTVFMCVMFLCGALGSAAGGLAWSFGAWRAVVGVGIVLPLLGLTLHLAAVERHPNR
jgi:predicted MFS family arabinose efflux permease